MLSENCSVFQVLKNDHVCWRTVGPFQEELTDQPEIWEGTPEKAGGAQGGSR